MTTDSMAQTLFGLNPADPAVGATRHDSPETSVAVAESMSNRLTWGSERANLLLAFSFDANAGGDGLTDELAGTTVQRMGAGAPIESVEATRRCSELRKYGLIEWTGESRPKRSGNASRVHRITQAGRDALYRARCEAKS